MGAPVPGETARALAAAGITLDVPDGATGEPGVVR
jgi:hypothetical protein